jgi:hypothetical protein
MRNLSSHVALLPFMYPLYFTFSQPQLPHSSGQQATPQSPSAETSTSPPFPLASSYSLTPRSARDSLSHHYYCGRATAGPSTLPVQPLPSLRQDPPCSMGCRCCTEERYYAEMALGGVAAAAAAAAIAFVPNFGVGGGGE